MPSADISGIWSGPVSSDDVARGDPGTVSAAITQNDCSLGGTWTFSFGDANLDKQLEIKGNVPQTTAVQMDLRQCNGAAGSCTSLASCDYRASGTLVSPTEISGTYTTVENCSFTESGSFDITLRARLTPTPAATALPIPTATPKP